MSVNVAIDPYGADMKPFVEELRRVLSNYTGAVAFNAQTVVFDLAAKAMHAYPYILACNVSLIFCVVALAFCSALAPVKMWFTVVVPIVAVYDVLTWVYQDCVLKFLDIDALTSSSNAGISWTLPFLTCSVLIGLALDYDMFLFASVLELRQKGFDNELAVQGAVCVTVPTITSAGLVMAIAFGGLLLSNIPASNMLGFVTAFGLLLHTFVICTCYVPATLCLFPGINFWPQNLVSPDKSAYDLEVLLCITDSSCITSGSRLTA